MYIPAELTMISYKPLRLESGMLFFRMVYPGSEKEYSELWKLNKPPQDEDMFLLVNGHPVELAISNDQGIILASHEEIGWFDEGEHSDELHEIELKELNIILKEYGGILEIQVNDNTPYIPIYQEEKVIIKYNN